MKDRVLGLLLEVTALANAAALWTWHEANTALGETRLRVLDGLLKPAVRPARQNRALLAELQAA